MPRSTLAAEVEAPGRTFPKALAGAVVLVVAMYVLPLAACLGVMPDALDWQLGFFATVAGNVGGPWLSWALVARRRRQPGDTLCIDVDGNRISRRGRLARWAGPWLAWALVAAAAVSQVGLLCKDAD